MTIGKVISFILAFPQLTEWFDRLAAVWVASRISSMKKEQADGIRTAINEHDQRELERAIGNPSAGEQSGVPGSEIRDTLPGVK